MKKQSVLWILGTLTLMTLLLILLFRREPNIDLRFHRLVLSEHDENFLGSKLFDLNEWPVFVFDLKKAELLNGAQSLTQGAQVKLFIEPPQKQWKRSELLVEITEAVQGHKIAFKLLSDSKDKLTSIFSQYTWEVRIQPHPSHPKFKSEIIGEGLATTSSPRSRFFGRLNEKLLMNQLYPFDLIKLGTFDLQKESLKNNMAPAYQ
jgi:hypothetical protein